MSTLSVNNIEPISGNILTISGSTIIIPGDLTVNGNVTGTVTTASQAITASYVAAANVDGTIANATTAVTSSFVSNILTIAPIDPLPSAVDGAIAFSASGDFYFGSGSAWNKLNL